MRKCMTGAVILVMLAVLLSFSAAADKVETNAITQVRITKDLSGIEVKAVFTEEFVNSTSKAEDNKIYLFELLPYQSTLRINDLVPIAEASPSSSVTLNVDFAQGTQSRLFAKYVLAVKSGESYSIVTNAFFIENPEVLASSTFAYPATTSMKGLAAQLNSDLQELGVGHTVITLPINEYMLVENEEGAHSYIFDNRTYYIDKEKLALLDHRIKVLSDAGINVYLDLVLTPPDENTPSRLRNLYFDTYSPSASFMAVNTTNQESILFLESFVTFITERYTRADAQYGFAGSFILGYEVNNNRRFNSMGNASMDSYLNSYVTAFRVVATAAKSVYSNARIYVPIANNWTAEVSDLTAEADPTLEYPGASFLKSFNEKLSHSGNFAWGIAVNPYPSDHAITRFWEDEGALRSQNSPYLTMANLNVISEFLADESLLYSGSKRSIVISDFAVSSGRNTPEEQSLQAAAYAAAYAAACSNPDVEAFIYHRQVDHAGENGLNYGLWTRVEGTTVTPSAKKTLYNVLKYIDTDTFADYETDILKTLGVKEWNELITGIDAPKSTRKIIETLNVHRNEIPTQYNEREIVQFGEGSLFGFYPSDNAAFVDLRPDPDDPESADDSRMYAKMYNVTPSEYMGVENIFEEPLMLEGGAYMTLRTKIVLPEGMTSASVMLRLCTKDMSVLYEGVATVTSGKWETLVFKLDELAAALGKDQGIDLMKLWVRPTDSIIADGEIGLWLDSVSVFDKTSIPFWQIALWTLVILIGLLLAAGVILIVYNQIKLKKIKRERARREAARARARLDAQNRARTQAGQGAPHSRAPSPTAEAKQAEQQIRRPQRQLPPQTTQPRTADPAQRRAPDGSSEQRNRPHAARRAPMTHNDNDKKDL
ncbi:MAG: hypothetical protein J6I45_03595 [Clostridia bacterium]|nr:hypothetical protein [Clostridia bacterium]